MPLILKQTPSYLSNNLSAFDSSLAFVSGSEVSLPHLNGEWRSITLQDESKCHQAKFVTLQTLTLLVLALDVGVQIWNASGTRMVFFLPLEGVIEFSPEEQKFTRGIAAVPYGSYIFVGTFTGDLIIISAQMEEDDRIEFLEAVPGHAAPISALAASQLHVVSADDEGSIIIRDVLEGFQPLHTIQGQGMPVTSLAIREDLLVASYNTGHLRFFLLSTGSMIAEIAAHSRCINALDIHPEQPLLASIGDDTYLNIWTLPETDEGAQGEGMTLLFSEQVHDKLLTGVSFLNHETRHIATSAYDCDGLPLWGRT